ncbi:hypothetical protein Pmar_PMAR006873 [Perkinsus marinus ATCC 50983]|uniref:RRM domain-containing protein n=1 Tax=Perkinsus marinus (strain ATCC 50983 / TXsc) TaxID=423536 RepID=C5K6Q6_PERM5|nr:hypothetical protein Pmar_PMAR006873 [Perkinsus marinus ATCC 50983]EER19976.1 hypothetical protein Pmar_PMAR006873 [Perkinsus marinus ATCC 50983]|eukprot:XP_002788180.1 hypothetical protein Pmar_PMAR006873 [Perkinsus marinus ATCC 50983]
MFTSDQLSATKGQKPTSDEVAVEPGCPAASSDTRDSQWRALPEVGPDENVEIARQFVEFMTNINEADNGYYATPEAATIDGVQRPPPPPYGGDSTMNQHGIEDFLGGGDAERLGYPLSMCVQGDEYCFQLSEDDLRKVFGRYGEVRLIEVTGPGRDVAHVYYEQLADAQNAIQDLNDKVLKGVQGVLRVVWGLYHAPSNFTRANLIITNHEQSQSSVVGEEDDDGRSGREEPSSNKGSLLGTDHGSCYDDATLNQLLSELRKGSSPLSSEELTKDLRDVPSTATASAVSSRRASEGIIGSPHLQGAEEPHGDEEEKDADETAVGVRAQKEVLPSTSEPMRSGSIRKYTCRFDIGIDNDREFQVARRIIGNKGSNMKRIVGLSNAKLRLRGQGSGYLEGAIRQESPDPLHLCISCITRNGYLAAVEETKTLLRRVYAEWRNFQINKGRGDPGMMEIQMKEHFLTGSSSSSSSAAAALSHSTQGAIFVITKFLNQYCY